MGPLTATYNVCPGCGAGVGARATTCALCEAPLPRSGRRSAGQRTPQSPDALGPAQQRVWRELARSLSPGIRIVGYLAEGGMGSVFLGYDIALKREVAIKVLAPELAEDAVARERFKREAEAAGGVSHPNVVAIHQVGEMLPSAIPYFVMQYVDGPTLQHAVQHRRLLPETRVRRILCDVAAGLAAAHRHGVVHRDIKPTNIVLDAETGRALVLDFGIAAALDARRGSSSMRLTTESGYVGTPMYMSPEQAGSSELTDRSDIYSLAVVAFELLTGRPPFHGGNSMALMAAHLRDAPPRVDTIRADVSPALASLLDRCLSKRPEDRPGSQALVDFFDPDAAASIAWPPPGLERGRAIGARLIGILAMLGLATLVFFTLLGTWPTPGSPEFGGGERSMLAASAVLVFVLVGLAIGTGVRVARLVARGREAGYPWAVVAEVLADRWRDTESLMNGRATYALTDAATRTGFLRLRRAQMTMFAIAGALALAAPVLWLFGLLVPGDAGVALVTRGELLALAGVPVSVAAIALLCAVPEVVWRRRNATHSPPDASVPAVREELVRDWLRVARRGLPLRSRRGLRPLITLAVVLAGGAVVTTVALALAAVLLSSALIVQARRSAGAFDPSTAPPSALTIAFAHPAAALPVSAHATGSAADATRGVTAHAAAAMCLNAREVLFGADARRVMRVRTMQQASGARDADLVRNGGDLLRPTHAVVPRLRSVVTAPTQSALAPLVGRALGLLGLGALRDRMQFCAGLLRA